MNNYNSPIYDSCKNWILDSIKYGDTWDDLMLARKSSDAELLNFLRNKKDDDRWPYMTIENWKELVTQLKEENTTTSIDESIWAIGKEQDNGIKKVPENPNSSWQTYKKYLLSEKSFGQETVDEMERATFRIIRRLRANLNDGPGKGLVVGNVQSGKTANIAALMAMAADWGWNFFIVLSGTIENLRKQTQNRLFNDLNRTDCNLNWTIKDKLCPNSNDQHKRPSALNLVNNNRYFTVYLKNSKNIEKLIKWLQEDTNVQGNLKVMVIDDEADQAGINTADISEDESTTINQIIKNIVHGYTFNSGLKKKGNSQSRHPIKKSKGSFCSMNYIGYTATPYANVLNEIGPDTLYPKDFLTILKGSKEYFGPQQIFGNADTGYDGLNIVREISSYDNEMIKNIHNGAESDLPASFQEALQWFLCGVACRRYWGDTSPVTMLIHTHHQNDKHQNIADAVKNWFKNTDNNNIVNECSTLYNTEKASFSKNDLLRDYNDYSGNLNNIRELPSWEDIRPLLEELLQGPLSAIPMGEDRKLKYHKGVHLCIDNCKHNGTNNNMVMRLIYPSDKKNPGFASAFIVVGGATLSRGLTLEGLICSYFLRTTKTCDTLMQMGRWFGYRKGYELLPRIWMTKDTQAKFEFLSDMDQDLRMEIQRMAANGMSPDECGPKIMNSPNLSFLRIVADNKQQSSIATDFDFSGTHKETTIFDCVKDTLEKNLKTTHSLISVLGNPEQHKECNRHAQNTHIWRNVPNERVIKFLKDFIFSPRQRFFNDIQSFIEWISLMEKDQLMDSWNVVLAGISDGRNGKWKCENISINKVTRTPLADQASKGVINIKRLLDPNDMLADVDLENANYELAQKWEEYQRKHSPEYVSIIRKLNGLDRTPRLMLYVINKNSKAESNKRVDLNASYDLIGIDIQIPGIPTSQSNARRITISIPEELKTNKAEDED